MTASKVSYITKQGERADGQKKQNERLCSCSIRKDPLARCYSQSSVPAGEEASERTTWSSEA